MYVNTAKETDNKEGLRETRCGEGVKAGTGPEAGILLLQGLEDILCSHTLGNTRRGYSGVLTEAITYSCDNDVDGSAGSCFWLSVAGMWLVV